MAEAAPILTSFNAGELSPLLEGRVDLSKYQSGCKVLENFVPTVQGPALKRSGTLFVHPVKDSTKTVKLVPFKQSTAAAYVLEFGDFYLRVFRNNAIITDASDALDGVTRGATTTILATGHPFANGNRVLITGVVGTTELNNREFLVASVAANSFEAKDPYTGASIDSSAWTAWSSGGTAARIYEIETPYAHTDLDALASWAQSADVLYLAHPDYTPYKLSRTSDTAWSIAKVAFDWPAFRDENDDKNLEVFFNGLTGDSTTVGFGSFPLGRTGSPLTVTAITNAAAAAVTTSAAHGLASGDEVFLLGVSGMDEVEGGVYKIKSTGASTFTLANPDTYADVNSTSYGVFSGTCQAFPLGIVAANVSGLAFEINSLSIVSDTATITTSSAHGWSTGYTVLLYGLGGTKEANNRVFTITVTGASTFTCAGFTGYSAYVTTPLKGLCCRVVDLDAKSIFEDGFAPDGFIKLREPAKSRSLDWTVINAWVSGTIARIIADNDGSPAAASMVRHEGNFYLCTDAGTTPAAGIALPPIHDILGVEEFDGPDAGTAAGWTFLHDGSSYLRLVDVINAGVARCYLPANQDPAAVSGNLTYGSVPITVCRQEDSATGTTSLDGGDVKVRTRNWAIGAWNAEYGFPRATTFFEDRLIFAGSEHDPQTVWMSRPGGYENHKVSDDDESSIAYTLNTDDVNMIEWLASGKVLAIGASGGEFIASASSQEEALTATNVRIVRHTNHGSRAAVRPVLVENVVLFAQRAGRKVREFVYQFESDSYAAPDMTVLADHMTDGIIKGMAFQQEPSRLVLAWMEDGSFRAMTYERAQEVVGWHKIILGGTAAAVKSAAVIPDAVEDEDQVWLIVSRTIDGGTWQYVERIARLWRVSDALEDGKLVDSCLTYDAAATTSLSGLYHLRGQTVQVLGDGVQQADKTVGATGKITGLTSASVFQIGLKYEAWLQTMRLEAGAAKGSSQGRRRRISQVVLRLHETGAGLYFGPVKDTTKMEALTLRDNFDPAGAVVTRYTGDTTIKPWPKGTERDREARITLYHASPFPCGLVAIMPEISVAEG